MDCPRRPRDVRHSLVARLALDRVRTPDWHGKQRDIPFRYAECRYAELHATPGDDRISARRAADVRAGREVPVLRIGPRIRPCLRQLRQQLDVSQSDEASARAAAES